MASNETERNVATYRNWMFDLDRHGDGKRRRAAGGFQAAIQEEVSPVLVDLSRFLFLHLSFRRN